MSSSPQQDSRESCSSRPNIEKIKRLLNMLGFKYKGCADNMYVYFYGEV